MADRTGAVMVVGGGIGGIQAALDLAAARFKVYLVEAKPAIGGHMAQLDKTFPTNDCSMCILSPKLVECGRHRNIEILTNAGLVDLEGQAGNFKARVVVHPRYVDMEKCTGCGECARVCVRRTVIPSEFEEGLGKRGAIYIPYPQAVPLKATVDPETCLYLKRGKCTLACVEACQPKAIDFDQKPLELLLGVGAVILAPGYEPYDARKSAEFGFGRYPNVVTSLQFERMLSASGPTGGHIQRPSDGRRPKKIAFLQCIGSRDQNHDYCSSVCCMYATKEAIMAKEHEPDTEIQIFMMDMRAFSKGYEEYYHRAQERYGVKYTRCRISALKEEPKTKDLIIRYEAENGTLLEERYDLVALSVGMEISEKSKELGQRLGLALDEYGFCLTPTFDPLVTSRLGVYACGPFVEPKDIPETVTEASAAAAKAGELLSTARGTLTGEPIYPPERKVEGEEPRVGVFVCHCGSNIAGFLDVSEVTAYAKSLPYVVHAEDNLYSCSQDTAEIIKERIKEHRLNRLVVAACTPRTHEPIFQETIRQAGLNPYLFQMANIRNQCSWVHSHDWEGATEKAKELVRMSVARAAALEPLHWTELPLERSALVIGGGVAGLNAALSLAEQGFPVHLVESNERLGGNLRRVHYDIYGSAPQAYLQDLVSRVENHDLITIHKETRLVETTGFIGNFSSRLETRGKIDLIDHGAIIVATGGRDYQGSEYLYGQEERVLTQGELEELIVQEPGKVAQAKEVVMIQCVPPMAQIGYCSRICCAVAVENALQIKELNPSTKVYILHKDLRTYGFLEREYEKARSKGIIFLRYDDEREPRLQNEGGDFKVTCYEQALEEEIVLHPDLVVLSTATLPSEGVKELASTLKVPLDLDGFFLEAHVKLRPLDFATDGIFLAGAAHYPKLVSEAIVQAQGAAGRVATILSQETLRVGGMVAVVESDRCTACLTCVRICPFAVPQLNREAMGAGAIRGAVEIEAARCRGCGICVAECPAKAIQLMHCRDAQVRAEEKALFREVVTA
ncbi:MAG: FAD-dependent oxidoreductase [Anaerolineae bacterium]